MPSCTNQLTIKGDPDRLKSFIRNNKGYPLLYKDKRKLYFPDNLSDDKKAKELLLKKEPIKKELLTFSKLLPPPNKLLNKNYDPEGCEWQLKNWSVKCDAQNTDLIDINIAQSWIEYDFKTSLNFPDLLYIAASKKYDDLDFWVEITPNMFFKMNFIKYCEGEMVFEETLLPEKLCNLSLANDCEYDKKCKTDDKFECEYERFNFNDIAIYDIRNAMEEA